METKFEVSLSLSIPSKYSDIPHSLMMLVENTHTQEKFSFVYSTKTNKFYEFKKGNDYVDSLHILTLEESKELERAILRRMGLVISMEEFVL